MAAVYSVPSLVVYTGTQNRYHIEWQSEGKDQIIQAIRVSTNSVVAEPDTLTMLAYQSSCVSFTHPLPYQPLQTLSQPVIQRSVLVLSFRPRPKRVRFRRHATTHYLCRLACSSEHISHLNAATTMDEIRRFQITNFVVM
jgi:hypothetical protein